MLFGAAEPGGRLPTSWPAALEDVPVRDVTPTDGRLDYTEGIHVGYRAWLRADRTPAFPFGYGLGYTTWSFDAIEVTDAAGADAAASGPGDAVVRVTVTNTGDRAGKHVVQVYAERADSEVERPVRWLVGFAVGARRRGGDRGRRRAGGRAPLRALERRLGGRAGRVHAARGQLGRRPVARRDARRGGGARAMSHPYPNPLIPGFNPDPSVVRVGDDYYLATSTFEYLPGVPIYHSRDFVTWTQIGNVATRVGQFDVEKVPTAGGAWAPTIRHRDGVFHLVITDAFGRGTLHFTADGPRRPVERRRSSSTGSTASTPTSSWDEDGTAYLTFSGLGVNPELPTFMKHRGLLQARVDLETGRALEEPRSIWSGVGGQFPEAPHLYRIGDWWYLVIAEGGTERGHSVSVARATSPEGPFENAPGNPLLTARGTDRPIQNTGHGDLVLGPDGEWLLVLLGVRPRSMTRAFSALGRETFVTTVTWGDDGWPAFEPVQLTPRPGTVAFREDFDAAGLGPSGCRCGARPRRSPTSARDPARSCCVPTARRSTTRSPCSSGTASSTRRRAPRSRIDVANGVGGLAVRYDERFHYSIAAGAGRIVARGAIPGLRAHRGAPVHGHDGRARAAQPPPRRGPVRGTHVGYRRARGDHRRGAHRARSSSTAATSLSETAESFTGRVIGLFALEGDVAVDWFAYEGDDE